MRILSVKGARTKVRRNTIDQNARLACRDNGPSRHGDICLAGISGIVCRGAGVRRPAEPGPSGRPVERLRGKPEIGRRTGGAEGRRFEPSRWSAEPKQRQVHLRIHLALLDELPRLTAQAVSCELVSGDCFPDQQGRCGDVGRVLARVGESGENTDYKSELSLEIPRLAE